PRARREEHSTRERRARERHAEHARAPAHGQLTAVIVRTARYSPGAVSSGASSSSVAPSEALSEPPEPRRLGFPSPLPLRSSEASRGGTTGPTVASPPR